MLSTGILSGSYTKKQAKSGLDAFNPFFCYTVRVYEPFLHSIPMANETTLPDHGQLSSNEHDIRVAKLQELQHRGCNPWPTWQGVTHSIAAFRAAYNPIEKVSGTIAGRLIAKREHGKTIFAHMQDASGVVQIYCRQDTAADAFALLSNSIDIGDIIAVHGSLFVTKTGETTVHVATLTLLSKCLHPLPEKFHGLSDQEVKYRQRYLDLMTNAQTRERFMKRSQIISLVRQYLEEREYIEVETPMLHPIPGGAAARPFKTHHNALDQELYMRIAPELYLKRLIIGGFERVFEINRNFRNEGISTRHNPEFTMLELYTAYEDYQYAMDLVEDLMRSVAQTICGALVVPYGERTIDFASPFVRLSMTDAICQVGTIAKNDLAPDRIDAILAQHAIAVTAPQNSHGHKIYALFEKLVEPTIWQPTFITDFPVEVSPLAKRHTPDSVVTDRFELFIGGMELANGFNELNDPFDQAARFAEQARAGESGDIEAMKFDQDFITALEYALPPTVGIGIGIDRFVMLLTNTASIKEVILFPTLKRKE